MSQSRGRPKCDWCKKAAQYEHLHVVDPAEYACEDHYNNCRSCRPLGDKYWKKAKQNG